MPTPKKAGLEELVNDFMHNYGRGRLRTCLACDSKHRELIDILLRGGAGGPSVSKFLRERLDTQIGDACLGRHKSEHLDAPAEKS